MYQKYTTRISNSLLQKMLISFVTDYCYNQEYIVGIDATGFKSAFSQYYDNKTTSNDAKITYQKYNIVDTNRQLICQR